MKLKLAPLFALLGVSIAPSGPMLLAQDNPAAASAPAPAANAASAAGAADVRRPVPPGGLRFNFRGAPLETVLNYMSEAAGFVIVLETPVRGTIDMFSAQPISRAEAVDLLNMALNKNGYTAVAQGKNLIVSSKDEAKKRNIPIRTGNDPQEIPPTAEMVMQIIPLRSIDASQAAADLATLLPSSATITANQDSNSLIVTDTQINVRHIVTLVAALDGSSDSTSAMRVFKLHNADPVEMANLITNIFSGPPGQVMGANIAAALAQRTTGRAGDNRNRRSAGGGNRGTSSASGARSSPIVAVPDPRTYSVIISASKDEMPGIADIVEQLDASNARKQKVYVYTLENADVRQVETVLRNLFQSSNARTTTTNQPDPLQTRASSNTQTAGPNIQLGTTRR